MEKQDGDNTHEYRVLVFACLHMKDSQNVPPDVHLGKQGCSFQDSLWVPSPKIFFHTKSI